MSWPWLLMRVLLLHGHYISIARRIQSKKKCKTSQTLWDCVHKKGTSPFRIHLVKYECAIDKIVISSGWMFLVTSDQCSRVLSSTSSRYPIKSSTRCWNISLWTTEHLSQAVERVNLRIMQTQGSKLNQSWQSGRASLCTTRWRRAIGKSSEIQAT